MYEEIFSEARLKRYKVSLNDSEYDIINRYLWNIELSAAFYPVLTLLEVVLRNRIYYTIENNIKSGWLDENNSWFEGNYKTINNIIEVKKAHKIVVIDKLISELTLGFWVYLFNKSFKTIIWDKNGIFDSVFPYFDIKTTDRLSVVAPRLRDLKNLRNRIFHHEAIFDNSDGLNNKYESVLLVLKWLSNDAYQLSKKISTFYSVWERQESDYMNKCSLIQLKAYYNHLNNPENTPEINWFIAEKELMNI
ncbi:MAG: hypothetical protein AB7V50_03475 [Vampirovibrionia bacterium]